MICYQNNTKCLIIKLNNPFFKETNKIIIEENYKEVSNILVYQLKNILNAFYLACLIGNTDIKYLNILTKQNLLKILVK